MWIRIAFNKDPNPAFNPDPNPGSQTNADPDPGQAFNSQKVEFFYEKHSVLNGYCS
jgi:hypothetical protein